MVEYSRRKNGYIVRILSCPSYPHPALIMTSYLIFLTSKRSYTFMHSRVLACTTPPRQPPQPPRTHITEFSLLISHICNLLSALS